MLKAAKKQMLAWSMVTAMVLTLFAGFTIPAKAATSITSASQFASMTADGDYKLGADIIITTPYASTFSGTFDGNGHTITMNITSGTTYVGAFKNVSGTVKNLDVNGYISSANLTTYVGGIAGYCTGTILNCDSDVAITATNAARVGGIVGQLNQPSSGTAKVQYCNAIGGVQASKQAGGIVGNMTCSSAGGAVVDNCSYKYSASSTSSSGTYAQPSGRIYTTTTGSKVWSGGLAGYCMGYLSNSYTYGITLKASGGHYLSGLVGILNGSNPRAGAMNCYSYVASWSGTNSGYDRPFVGSVDSSSTLVIKNCGWVNSVGYAQPTASGWGNRINCFAITDPADLSGNIGTLNNPDAQYENASSYPTLKCEQLSASEIEDLGYSPNYAALSVSLTDYDSTDASSAIYVDPTGNTSGAYTDISSAVAAATTAGQVIFVKNAIEITGDTSLSNTNGCIIKRSSTYDGNLFMVEDGATLTLGSGITVDGNSARLANVTACGSLVLVDKGSAVINGATLQNNYAGAGGAIRVDGSNSSATLNTGMITGCTCNQNGGAVAIQSKGAFTMNGGSISGNGVASGGTGHGSIFVGPQSTFNLASANGIASSDLIYLSNSDGLSNTYITLQITLTANITVQMANPASGIMVAKASNATIQSNSYNNVSYVDSSFSIVSGGSTSRNIVLASS